MKRFFITVLALASFSAQAIDVACKDKNGSVIFIHEKEAKFIDNIRGDESTWKRDIFNENSYVYRAKNTSYELMYLPISGYAVVLNKQNHRYFDGKCENL